MRRVLVAAFALAAALLPFLAVGQGVGPAASCCPCMAAPTCPPPQCPGPAPYLACAGVVSAPAIPAEGVQAVSDRRQEPSPAPFALIARVDAAMRARRSLEAVPDSGPPDRGGHQALLRVFRI